MSKQPLVASFGELLIRIQSTSSHLVNTSAVIYPGGSEANVIFALAQQNVNARYLTAVPKNSIVNEIVHEMDNKLIDTSKIIYNGDRLGTYFLLSANGLSKGEVIYDRKYSSFAQLKREEIDWYNLLADCDWLHWSALTPALSENLAIIMEEGLKVAQSKKITISVDLNYREKLWQYGKKPIEIMPKLVKYCNVIMGNIWASNKMLGTSLAQSFNKYTSKQNYIDFANLVSKEIFEQYSKCNYIANTFRFMDNDEHNSLFGTYHTHEKNYYTQTLETNVLVDRIGSGDAFMAGLIYGHINNLPAEQIIYSALEFGFKKLFNAGDFIQFDN